MGDRSVLQVLGPSTGGIRRHVAQPAHTLPTMGWEVEVAGPAGVATGADLGPVAVVPVPSGPSPAAVVRARSALAPLARSAALVHAHGLKAGWVGVLTPKPGPLVVTVHNLVLDEASGRSAGALRWLEGRLPRHVDAVIAVSDEIAARFGGPSDRVRVVPPAGPPPQPTRTAAEVRAGLGVAPGAPLVVCVARLHPQKDLPTLLHAAEVLRVSIPDVQIVIVGEGPQEEELQRTVDGRGLAGVVRLAGPSTNAADEMAAADAVVVTSLWESGPLVAAEALLLGRPLVSTPVGFVPRLVEDGVSGRLVPVGDGAAVAAALVATLRDAPAAARLAAAGRQRVLDRLGPSRLVADVGAVYDEVLSRRGGAR
jgi:glycosyltransferase involved in cell wall biosynthesis